MPRYKITVSYEGTHYSGWQKQPNAQTVEGRVEEALSQILPDPVDVIGQGRTDSGVHAQAQTAHFDVSDTLDESRLLYALLGVLPKDIAVWDIEEVNPDFHARFDAFSRTYRYQIALRPMPLLRRTSTLVLDDLNLTALQNCARIVLGDHDFKNFTKADNKNPDSTCTVSISEFIKRDSLIIYRIEANRFVRHMVRRLTGTMLEAAKSKRKVAEFEAMITNPNKRVHAHGAPPGGLILEKVKYKNNSKKS